MIALGNQAIKPKLQQSKERSLELLQAKRERRCKKKEDIRVECLYIMIVAECNLNSSSGWVTHKCVNTQDSEYKHKILWLHDVISENLKILFFNEQYFPSRTEFLKASFYYVGP